MKIRVFISYAKVNNLPPTGTKEGWVDRFEMELKNRLAEEVGRSEHFELWRDNARLNNFEDIGGQIDEALKDTDIFLMVVSRAYLASRWCTDIELPTFLARHFGQRIFCVKMRPIAPDDLPADGAAIRDVLCRKRDVRAVTEDVIEMRAAIATEKGDADPWDLKYAAGALVDIEFIAQYLQLVHAAAMPDILDTSTARVLEKAAQLGLLAAADAAVLRGAVRLYHDLTQILRLCLPGAFDPKTASAGVLGLLARAADLPDFPALEAHVMETQRQVRECFVRILGRVPGRDASA